MKKLFLLIASFVLAAGAANAQEIFSRGDLVGNLGIGLNSDLYNASYYSNKIPPLSVSMEYSLRDNLIQGNNGAIGIGGYFGYTSARQNISIPGTMTGHMSYTAIIIGARGTFHYQFVDKLDTYAGLMLGYTLQSAKWHGDSINVAAADNEFTFSLFVGARYYFTEQFGVFAEIGYGIANFNLGVTYKF